MDLTEAWVGLDVGSTTVKVAVIDPDSARLVSSNYLRHNADQCATVLMLLKDIESQFPNTHIRVAVCGSGGRDIAERLGAFYVQEVVATSIAVTASGENVRSVIELGGQDAKVILLRESDADDGMRLVPHEMRMNGSCAGGTGAFIDQIAELLRVPIEEFDSLAARGVPRYDISGRCGVFAKTDIQPLLHRGAAAEDIAISSFHAIAKQTIGGLAQGLRFEPPVLFAGGPLTFNPSLVGVFQERLSLGAGQTVVPDRPEIFVARGAALSIGTLFKNKPSVYRGPSALVSATEPGVVCARDGGNPEHHSVKQQPNPPFFASRDEEQRFRMRHSGARPSTHPILQEALSGREIRCFLGIDAGSTTTKFVLLDEDLEVLYRFYSANGGDALGMTRDALIVMRNEFRSAGIRLDVRAAATTGYGEMLFAAAFGADTHQVETVAHARAASHYVPDVSFVLDIGGQDMKAIEIRDGIITNIVLNEACSAGCGSFIETYANSLGVPVDRIAPLAFESAMPSRLGSRCTVFMNSSIITEQKNGKSREDILAGLCRSVIENVFTKVIRTSNLDRLGKRIVVQGGTFRNHAVLRAMEEYVGHEVYCPPYAGEMGAIGAALIAREWALENPTTSSFIGLDSLETFRYERHPGIVCSACTNNCSRTVVTFPGSSGAAYHVTGNQCERGNSLDGVLPGLELNEKQTQSSRRRQSHGPADMMKTYAKLLVAGDGDAQSTPSAAKTTAMDTVLPGTGFTVGNSARARVLPQPSILANAL